MQVMLRNVAAYIENKAVIR